jgi:Flp pilus assembly protein TadG
MRPSRDRLLRRLAPQESGNVLIEFALALPVLCLMLVGGFDIGRYALQKSAVAQGARAGAQYGVFNPTDSANINATAESASGLSGVTATNTLFCECTAGTSISCSTTSCSSGQPPTRYITVSTSKAYSSVAGKATVDFGIFGSWTPPTSMSASVTMIVPP